jgi:hypothetical protein
MPTWEANIEYELLRFAMLRELGGRSQFLHFLSAQVFGSVGSHDVGLFADSAADWNPREPWYSGWTEEYPNRGLLITASAEAMARLFSRYHGDGVHIGKGSPRLCAIQIQAAGSANPVVRVNCGGDAVGDWTADTADRDGSWRTSSTDAIDLAGAGGAPQAIYQTAREGYFTYSFDLPPGLYTVTLKFAETAGHVAGDCVFSLTANNQLRVKNLDLVQSAGAANKAVDRQFSITVDPSFPRIVISGEADLDSSAWTGRYPAAAPSCSSSSIWAWSLLPS